MPRPRYERRRDLVCPDHGTVDAEAHVTALGEWDRAPEAGAESARHRRLHGELGRHAAIEAHPAYGLEHRRRPAAVDDRAARVIPFEEHGEEVRHVALVAGVAVLAREADLGAVEELQPAG